MSRPRIPIAGLLVAIALLAVVFNLFSRPSQALPNLWNLAVWTMPPTTILYAYGSDRCRSWIRSVAVRLFYLVLGLLVFVGSGLLVVFLMGVFGRVALLDVPTTLVLGSTVLIMAMVTRRAPWGAGPHRAFAVGFAAFGWPFLLLGLAPALDQRVPVLWTSEFLHQLYPHWYLMSFPDPWPSVPTLATSVRVSRPGGIVIGPAPQPYLQFQFIGHCVISLGIAMAGGLLARTLAKRRQAPAASGDEASPTLRLSSRATSFHPFFGAPTRPLPGRNS
jgi:hypothetical protein